MAARTEGEARRGPRPPRGGRTIVLLAVLGALLSGCGGKSTREWIEQLRSGDAAERLHAVKALGETREDPNVIVPALVETLRDEDAFVRRDAAEALGKIGAGAAPAVPALLAAMQDRNPGVRREAARALNRIKPGAGGKVAGQ